MKRSFQKMMLVLGASLVLPLTACPDITDTACESDLDCEGTDQCNPLSGACEADCTLEDFEGCPAEAPVCNEADADGNYPLETFLEESGETVATEDEQLRLLCICVQDSDCGDGEVCNAETRTCEAGDAQPECEIDDECAEGETCNDEGQCVAEESCGEIGDLNDEGEVCTADGFQPVCDNDTCLDEDLLCEIYTESAQFNQCEDPDVVTNYCPAGDAFGARDDAGPVIYDVDYEPYPDLDADCDAAVAGTEAYLVSFLYWDADGDAYTAQSPASFNAFVWAEEGSSAAVSTLPLSFEDADEFSGIVGMTICFASAPDILAVQIEDESGNVSNAACAELQ